MVGRFDGVKQGDLCGNLEDVHVPDSKRADRYEEPAAQESERPESRGNRATQRVPRGGAKAPTGGFNPPSAGRKVDAE